MNLIDIVFGKRPHFTFHTALDKNECLKRLAAAINETHRSGVIRVFSADISGEMDGNKFALWRRGFAVIRNPFKAEFYGTLLNEDGCTRIEGYFSANRYLIYFVFLWLSVVLAFSMIIPTLLIFGIGTVRYSSETIYLPILMLIGTITWARLGTWWGRREHTPILAFIQRALEAKRI